MAAVERLSSDETMCSASLSTSDDAGPWSERMMPISHIGSRGKPSLSLRMRMPGFSADSASAVMARPAVTAAEIADELELW